VRPRIVSAFVSGLLVSAGLCLSGMTNPAIVLGFLDFLGHWDPTLVFVMAGAVGTHAILYRLITRRRNPMFAAQFSLPAKRAVDAPLLIGAAVFGVGWGLSGYCPGPVIAALPWGGRPALAFVAGMFGGMAAYGAWYRDRAVGPLGAPSPILASPE
jgi:uncharacterized membrane protein YedE/YeeE